jgi:hypothetical protein
MAIKIKTKENREAKTANRALQKDLKAKVEEVEEQNQLIQALRMQLEGNSSHEHY